MIQSITGLSNPPTSTEEKPSAVTRVEQSFMAMLKDTVEQVNAQQIAADQAVQEVHAGGEKNLHEAMIALEQADISVRYLVQVRNKMLEAYQEIMRMQV
ncbi:flagellar hook-basal body complex protein FliE [Desulfolithobacter sp.]